MLRMHVMLLLTNGGLHGQPKARILLPEDDHKALKDVRRLAGHVR